MSTFPSIPGYVKATILLLGFSLLVNLLSAGKSILLPFLYASLVAILFSPVVQYQVRLGIHRTVAIGIVLLGFIILFSLLFMLFFSQMSLLSDALPALQLKFDEMLDKGIHQVSMYSSISADRINGWVNTIKSNVFENSGAALGTTLTSIGVLLATMMLTPVYVFMLLYYQPHLIKFSYKLFKGRNRDEVEEVFSETQILIQSYLVGLFFEFVIVAILNAIGLLILDINYAIILGIIGALLNIIPYIGGLIAVIMFMLIALVTKEPQYVLYVVILYLIIQFVDNHYIVPKIVGSRVKLNALVSLFAVIAGGVLWGVPGMFLSIPILSIIKLLFDRIDSLKSLGFLLGESPVSPTTSK